MVKLVDYPDSSDDEQIPADAGMKSDSEWSSFGELPSDSGDSFSFQMGSPEPSDIEKDEEDDEDDGDEDYVPSASSSSPLSSPSSSDLEPSPRCSFDEEKPRTSLFRGFSAADTDTTTSTDERGSSEESTATGRMRSVNGSTANSAKSDSKTMFYAWSDLSAAFEENPFKRRSVAPGNGSFTMKSNVGEENKAAERAEDHPEDENMATTSPMEAADGDDEIQSDGHGLQHDHESMSLPAHAENAFDSVQGRWGSHPPAGNAGFGAEGSVRQEEQPGFGKKARQRSQRHEPFRRHPSGISPRLTKASSEKQSRATANESAAFFTFESMTHENRNEESSNAGAAKAPSFNDFPSQAKTSFGFGSKPTAASSSSFKPTSFSFETPDATKLDGSIDDTPMRSPSPPATSAASSSNDNGFLFGWGYKNRKPFDFADQGGNGTFDSTFDSTATHEAFNEDTAASLRAQTSVNGAATARYGENGAHKAAFFTPGVADSTQQQRSRGNFGRRRKLNGSSATPSPPQAGANASKMPPPPPPAFTPFGSSHFPTATSHAHAPHEAPFAASTGASTASWENAFGQHPAATEPGPPPAPKAATSLPFVFGKTSAAEFTAAGSSSMRSTSAFDSRNPTTDAPVNPNVGASTQFPFGMKASKAPFLFGRKESIDSQSTTRQRQFPGRPVDHLKSTFGEFRIGSADVKMTPQRGARARRRPNGMFTNKNSPRREPMPRAHEPEPSPGSSSSSTSASPFGLNRPGAAFSNKNARQRRVFASSPPADPFVTPIFQSCQPSSASESSRGADHPQPKVIRPTAKKDLRFAFGESATMTHNRDSGEVKQSESFSFQTEGAKPPGASAFQHPPLFPSSGVNRPATSFESQPATTFGLGNPPPPRVNTHARRILRAVHRSAEAHTNDTSNSSSGDLEEDEGDAEMESDEDDRDWGELKRLGGVAYSAKQYADAAEYYRQSIEVLESLLDRDPEMETHELVTDKAKLHANRAASLMMLMQIPEAQRECRRSIEVDPSYTRAYLRLGRIQVLLGDTTHAQTNLDTAKQLMAEKMGEEDSNDRADQASVLRMEATIKKLTTLQGEIRWCVDVGDFKQALAHTENALALAPSSRKLQVQKVRILLQQKKFDLIVQLCTEIVRKQQAVLGEASHGEGENASQSSREKTVDEIAFVGIDLGLLWAKTLHYQNKVEDAVRILGALEVVAPCSSHVVQLKRQWQDMKQLKHSGNERFKHGEYREAVRFYSEAVEIDAQHDEYCAIIYCNRAAAQMGLERYHTALRDCDEALQRKAQYSRALLRRARCYVALSKFQEAVKDFDRYLREHPGDSSSGQAEDIRRERNEAKAAVAKTREEARKREAAKKRAEREQRQRRAQHWDQAWDDSKFYENFRRGSSSSRFKAAGANGRSSFMEKKTQRRTHYDVLGLEKVATCDQIKKAYRKLALVYHPDKSNTASHVDLFKEMTAAYNVLSDESARAKYDRELVYSRFGNFYEN